MENPSIRIPSSVPEVLIGSTLEYEGCLNSGSFCAAVLVSEAPIELQSTYWIAGS